VEEIGLVDLLSGGRLVIGIGTGYQRFEFEKMGQELDERLERSLEMAEIMERSFSDDILSYSGKYYQVADVPLCTRTLNRRRPEIYVTGGQPEMIARAAKLGWIPFVTVGAQDQAALVSLRNYVESQYVKAGGDAAAMPFAVQRYVYVTNSKADALDAAERILYVNRLAFSMRFNYQELDGPMLKPIPYKDEPTLEQIVDNVIIGDAHHCAERMAEATRTLKPMHWSCFMQFGGMEGRRALRSLERFGSEVIPLLERDLGRKLVSAEPAPVARRA
jgi:alkanesulfonate monooxygenase SsuD/methylene tetrahydromethanopterin reductase-like flavin-dependent oxidoreductase (luciferase family)